MFRIGENVRDLLVGRGVAAEARTAGWESGFASRALDPTVSATFVSNDPGYTGGRTWGMLGDQTGSINVYGSQAGEAWQAGYTGSTKVAVGVVDSGIDYAHADLYLNIWLNNAEIPVAVRSGLVDFDSDGAITFRDLNAAANAASVSDLNANGRIDAGDLLADARWEDGVDQDSNGYRDDLIGWDFANGDNDPFDDNGHGTHVAGTIAATGGNGIGVAGVTWNTLLVPLKFLAADGSGSTSNAVRALDYFTGAAARSTTVDFVATNNSWGGGSYSQALFDAIVRGARQDVLFIASAGNGGSDSIGDDNDAAGQYPAVYDTTAAVGFDAVISVAAITAIGTLAGYSNFGLNTVEIGAPGSSIYSTLAGGSYGSKSGTSMAAPHVAGAIAMFAAATGAGAAELRFELLAAAAPTTSLAGKTMTAGRLDVMKLMEQAFAAPPSTVTGINGTSASDTLGGTAGMDRISGVPGAGTALGRNTVDTLTGNGGNDLFVLGDSRGLFYDDGRARLAGTADYARIMDFAAGDQLQLKGTFADYKFRPLTLDGISGTGVYHDTNDNSRFDPRDELIALLSGNHVISSGDLLFV